MTSARVLTRAVAFTLLCPVVLAAVVPLALARVTLSPIGLDSLVFSTALPVSVIGAALMGVGIGCYALAFWALVNHGARTPIPIDGHDRLVTDGIYAHVRNPMLMGICLYILGTGLWLDSTAVVGYAGLLWTAFFMLVNGVKEPRLERRYGDAYRHYCAHVSRWLPRFRPYEPSAETPPEGESPADD